MKTTRAGAGALVELGLNALEASCYESLVADGRATAYELARRLGKPAANVYKAVASLAAKGAAAVRSGAGSGGKRGEGTREFEALPPAEFLRRLEKRHAALREEAAARLKKLAPAPDPSQFYAIESVDAVFERASAMIRGSKKIVVVDAFPGAMARVEADVRAAAARGVAVYVQVYGGLAGGPLGRAGTAERVSVATAAEAGRVLEYWKGEQLNVAADGREVLLALMTVGCGRVVQAFWSNALYLACMHHAGFLREHAYHLARAAAERGAGPEELRRVLEASPVFHGSEVPGQRALAVQLAAMSGAPS